MADEAEMETARYQWEDGLRRMQLREGDAATRARRRVMTACQDQLRRRLGMTFTLSQLVDDYRDAPGWFLPLAARIAPRNPDVWDTSVVMDAAYGEFARRASDASRRVM